MSKAKKFIVKQVRSGHGKGPNVIRTLAALGLGRIGREREHTVNQCVVGMIEVVKHVVEIREAQ